MKTYAFLLFNLVIVTVLSQDFRMLQENRPKANYTIKNIRRGDKSDMLIPSENSERIKYKIETNRDTSFFSLRAEKFEQGIFTPEEFFDEIKRKRKVHKGDKISFELIPDVSDSLKMALYINSVEGTHYRFFDGIENKRIKYRKFKEVDNADFNIVPLILCYPDDEYGHVEKLLDKYSAGNLITITAVDEFQEKILKNIEKCMLIYYDLTEK